ncbi:MAG TPA: transcriptional regulator GcvA [Azospirillaceae bacterium]|nr:transcriptional regulator GcvA [Azospirillaceae bacterium]
MVRRLPPLNALRTFEAAARHLSFTRAAEELAVTQAAVSYQIRQLEEHVGRPLFLRLTRSLALTEAGAELLPVVADAFDRIRLTVERLGERRGGQVLSISALPTFAAHWLVPRLGHFQVMRPDIAVRLEATPRLVDLEREDVDVAIRSGQGVWPGLRSEKLVDFRITPLLAPSLAERAGGVRAPEDLLKLPLIGGLDADDARDWHDWFRLAGHPVTALPPGPHFGTHGMAGQAAAMGQGVAMLCPTFFAGEIASGRLLMPFPGLILDTKSAYWLAFPERRAEEPKIKAFADWLRQEVGACGDRCALIV